MRTDFLQTLEIFTELAFHTVRQNLGIFTIDDIALTVEEPCRDLVLCRVLDDSDDTLEFFGGNFTGTERMNRVSVMAIDHRWVCSCKMHGRNIGYTYRLFKSTSAFLHTRLEYRRPTPLILVKAYMIFCFPSTFVLRSRRMNWKFDFSPVTRAATVVIISSVKSRLKDRRKRKRHHLHMMFEAWLDRCRWTWRTQLT